MRRVPIIIAFGLILPLAGVALAAVAGIPEVDRANATFHVEPRGFVAVDCPGEDGLPYRTLRGKWVGPEVETTPGFTDYVLSGTLTVSNVVWTINLETARGVLKAAAALKTPAGAKSYSGSLVAITQGIPAPGATVVGRGWIPASTFIGGVADGGTLLANVEIKVDGALVMDGTFGDMAPPFGFPNFSATTINQSC